MRLTSVDINNKEFSKSMVGGYSPYQVDEFLDQIADDYDELYKENLVLKEKLSANEERLEHYAKIENTIQNTLMMATNSAEQVKASAQKEAELIIRNASEESKRIIEKAHKDLVFVNEDYGKLKQEFLKYRARFKSFMKIQLDTFQDLENELVKNFDMDPIPQSISQNTLDNDIVNVKPETPSTKDDGMVGFNMQNINAPQNLNYGKVSTPFVNEVPSANIKNQSDMQKGNFTKPNETFDDFKAFNEKYNNVFSNQNLDSNVKNDLNFNAQNVQSTQNKSKNLNNYPNSNMNLNQGSWAANQNTSFNQSFNESQPAKNEINQKTFDTSSFIDFNNQNNNVAQNNPYFNQNQFENMNENKDLNVNQYDNKSFNEFKEFLEPSFQNKEQQNLQNQGFTFPNKPQQVQNNEPELNLNAFNKTQNDSLIDDDDDFAEIKNFFANDK